MSSEDRRLGMNADISRRDFLNGVSVAIGASLLPRYGATAEQDLAGYYPPALTGMRGSHAGSFEVAHQVRDGSEWQGEETGETYDLVVVGAGISGLSAAWFYRREAGKNARVLLLDNHDDFGGHAKRNEFEIDGRLMIGYGGTQSLESPGSYPDIAKNMIDALGIDTQRFYQAFDRKLYRSLGLQRATFFDRESYGRDHLAVGSLADPDIRSKTPFSDLAKEDAGRLFADDKHYLDGLPRSEWLSYLGKTSYEKYLRDRGKFSDEFLNFYRRRRIGLWAISNDALPARSAWSSGFPGFGDLELGVASYRREESEPYIFHFPDGNASVARLIVRQLIPGVARGDDMNDIVTARFDYGKLDEEKSPVRIRLNSTVVRARHVNDEHKNAVRVTYVRDGEARTVTAGKVVMACYHAIIPGLCPEIPGEQKRFLRASQRAPLIYTNVLIRNWTSFAKLGIQRVYCPGAYHHGVTLDFPVSLGEYAFARSPEEPMILHLTRIPIFAGLSAKEQFRSSKLELLSTPFSVFERNIRSDLGRMLADGGFDPARDIEGITVNRWAHGYAYGCDPDSGQIAFEPSQWPESRHFWTAASRKFGNIAIAASDAAANAMTESAIEEAHRAVRELT